MEGIAVYIVILLVIGEILLLLIVVAKRWKQGRISPAMTVSTLVSGVIVAALLAVITDRISRDIWTFSQMG